MRCCPLAHCLTCTGRPLAVLAAWPSRLLPHLAPAPARPPPPLSRTLASNLHCAPVFRGMSMAVSTGSDTPILVGGVFISCAHLQAP